MDRLRRVFVLLLLVSMWTSSLLAMAYPARAQAPDGPSNGIHVVEAGETLNSIARTYGTDVKTLLQLNDLDDANLLYVGQQLVVAGENRRNQPAGQGEDRRSEGENGQPPQRAGVAWDAQPQDRAGSGPSVSWSNPDGSPVEWAGEEPEAADHAWPSSDDAQNSWERQTPQRQYEDESEQAPATGSVAWSSPSDNDDQDEGWEDVTSGRQGVAWEPERGPRSPNNSDSDRQASYQPEESSRQGAPSGEKWIDVDLSEQRLFAYEGDSVVRVFSISSGATKTPTVTGSFRIYAKIVEQDMSGGSVAAGDYYYQEDVPWVQYFFEDYSIHGAYWHNMFGQRTGHGCINMRVEEARWLFDWAEPEMDPTGMTSEGWLFTSASRTGTRVEVHE